MRIKKSHNRYLVIILLLLFLSSLFCGQAQAYYPDIGNSTAKYAIIALSDEGIIKGHKDGTFKPNNPITRAEFAVILAGILNLPDQPEKANHFRDVHSWARGAVGALVNANIVAGKEATFFGADDYLTREDMAVFFVRALGYQQQAESLNLNLPLKDVRYISNYAVRHVAFAYNIGLINGYTNGHFGPRDLSKREQVAHLAYQVYKKRADYTNAANNLIKNHQPVKIFIDPGHGGRDAGAVSPINKIKEKDIALEISLLAAEILEREYAGVVVRLSRTTDVYPTLSERVAMANNWSADYFVSIHHNAGGGTGFESYRYGNNPRTVDLQRQIHTHIATHLQNSYGLRDRGMKTANFYVLRYTSMPAILLELLFLDHAYDASLLQQKSFRQYLAHLVAEAIAKAHGLEKKQYY